MLQTEGDFPATSLNDFVVECGLAVRDGLLVIAALPVDGFNDLDVGFLPDERSAKEQCIVEMWFVCTTIGGWLGGNGRKYSWRDTFLSAPSAIGAL